MLQGRQGPLLPRRAKLARELRATLGDDFILLHDQMERDAVVVAV